MNEFRTIQVIYFDEIDEAGDGFGWNMIDEGSIATRLSTMEECIAVCEVNALPYIVLSKTVTLDEAAHALHACRV
jgi:hypothetical protein